VKHKATLGEIVDLLHKFHDFPQDYIINSLTPGSFEKKLYAMYLSYLPREKTVFDYKMNVDQRGSFTELIRILEASLISSALHAVLITWLLHRMPISYYVMGAAVNTTLIAGVFRAGGDSRFGFICDTIDMWCYAVPLGFLAAAVLKLPPMWVYFLLCTDEFVKWPWVIRHYLSRKWLKNITREGLFENQE
jgi:hypothetical protein